MFGGYERTFNYQLPPELLTEAMNEAVDRYLALHQNVFPTGRQDSSVELKVQKSYVSRGETIVVSVRDRRFYVASRFIEKSPKSSVACLRPYHDPITTRPAYPTASMASFKASGLPDSS